MEWKKKKENNLYTPVKGYLCGFPQLNIFKLKYMSAFYSQRNMQKNKKYDLRDNRKSDRIRLALKSNKNVFFTHFSLS